MSKGPQRGGLAGILCLWSRSALGRIARVAGAGLFLAVTAQVAPAAGGPHPFLTADQNPFIQIFSLPLPRNPQRVQAGAWDLDFVLDLTNNSIGEGAATEEIILDGETYRSTLMVSRGLSGGLEAGIAIPYVMHRRGVFDSFIENWHDTFGLSNRKRTAFERDQLVFSHEDPDGSLVLDEPAEGLGDIRLFLGLPLGEDRAAGRDYALHLSLKLPSGDAAKLLGSGGTDLALQLSAMDTALLERWRTALFWSLGALRLGSGEVLEAIRRDYVAIAMVGTETALTDRLSLKAQIDAHTSFYDSGLAALGSDSVQLTVGGTIGLGGRNVLDLGLVENLFTDTTPDLVFHLAWRTIL